MNDHVEIKPSSQLVEFLVSLKLEGLPTSVVRDAKLRLLDCLGCGFYGALAPWGEISARMVYEEGSTGKATMYGFRDPVAPARASLVNGTTTHGMEIDDAVSAVHPGAVVVSAALATAEQYEASGARLLLGIIAGYEATSRISDAIGEIGWGFHKTGIAGVVGAAVASCATLDMTHEQTLCAIGIACSSASGIRSFAQSNGGMIKRMHAGHAAESGLTACLLARQGFTAPRAAIDGKFGLVEVYGGDEASIVPIGEKLGADYAVSRVWTKMFPCCGALHTAAQGVYELRTENRVEHSAVEKIRLGVNHRVPLLHTEVAPKDTMSAQYSMPFTAASALVRDPRDPRCYADEALNDPVVCAIACEVELYEHPEIDAVYPRQAAHVELHLKNGTVLEKRLLEAHGTPADPCSEPELKEKFRFLARACLNESAISEISSLVERMDALPSVAPLSAAMRWGVERRRA